MPKRSQRIFPKLVSDLKYASFSLAKTFWWGVHAVNGTSDYYEIFHATNYADARVGYIHTTLPWCFWVSPPSQLHDVLTRISGHYYRRYLNHTLRAAIRPKHHVFGWYIEVINFNK